MFKKLKSRWKVNEVNLVLIIATFALGGSLCGYAGRKILLLTELEKGLAWIMLYLLLVILLWPACVLLISIPLGQFAFFKKYISKIWKKMRPPGSQGKRNRQQAVTRIAIFASGAGTNARQIITSSKASRQRKTGSLQREMGYSKNEANGSAYEVALIVCNKPGAGVLQIAEKENIPTLLIEKERFFTGDHYLAELQEHKIDFIVLAGFLWKMPAPVIQAYPRKIINIHPALLPRYGGKGMYGNKVHESVIAAGEKESGITIHYVDEQYDHGAVIFQAKCPVTGQDTAETLAQKIHVLEHTHYPPVIAEILQKQQSR